jgi:RNA polymerase sigma-32 factor
MVASQRPSDTDDDPIESSDDDDALDAEIVDESELDAMDAEVVDAPAVELGGKLTRGRSAPKGTGPLARYDPLQAYMRDVQRYRLLTPEEEKATALAYYEEGDVDAAARLVTANLRLVVKIAYEYRRAHKHLPDLIQEGNVGLMQAVKKFDPYKGVKLSTYAAWWIRAYILRFILNNARLVKLGTTQAQRKLFFNLKKEKAKLAAMGIEPSPEVVAKRLNVSEDEVVQMDRRLAAGDMSLDTPVRSGDEGAPARVDLLPGSGERVDDVVADAEMNELLTGKLHEFGETLEGKDARIFHARMLTEEPMTLQELGDEFGVSRERVRQLEKRLQLRLRDYLAAELGAETLEDR